MRFPRRATVTALVVLGVGHATAAWADPSPLPPPVIYNYGETDEPRGAAMSGAIRALGNGATALFTNPADMVETRVYHIEALAQITPETGRQAYGGVIVDSVTGRLAGAVSVVGGFMDKDGIDRSTLDVRGGLAYPISDKFFLGLSGRYAKVSQGGLGVFGKDPVSGGLVDPGGGRFAFVNTMTFDAGLTIRASDSFFISAVGQNLTYPNNGLLPTLVGGGIAYGNQDLSIEADGVADLSSYAKPTARLMLGGEYLAGDHFPLRLGYRYDQGAKLHWLSGGLGYIANEFSVEASVRRSLSNPGATMLVFGVAYFLESTGVTKGSQQPAPPGALEVAQ